MSTIVEQTLLTEYSNLSKIVSEMESKAAIVKYREAIELRDAKLDQIKQAVRTKGTAPNSDYVSKGGKVYTAAASAGLILEVTFKKQADYFNVSLLPEWAFDKAVTSDVKTDLMKYKADNAKAEKQKQIMAAYIEGPWLTPSVSVKAQ